MEKTNKCIGETSGEIHDFCIFKDGIISEDNEVLLGCNNLPCEEERLYKIRLLDLQEIDKEIN